MAWGASAKDGYGNEVLTTMQPFNFIGTYPVYNGTHTITVNALDGSLEWFYDMNHPSGGHDGIVLKSVSISGKSLTYTAGPPQYYSAFAKKPVLYLFTRR